MVGFGLLDSYVNSPIKTRINIYNISESGFKWVIECDTSYIWYNIFIYYFASIHPDIEIGEDELPSNGNTLKFGSGQRSMNIKKKFY